MSLSLACVAKLQENMLFGAMAKRKGWDTTELYVLQTSVMQATEHCLCSQACKDPLLF